MAALGPVAKKDFAGDTPIRELAVDRMITISCGSIINVSTHVI